MISAIVFDFDGVLIESAEIKTKAFEALFSAHPEKVQSIVKYHRQHMGISRYVKFKYIYENILGLELTPVKEAELGEEFARLVLAEVLAAPLVNGAEEFLAGNAGRRGLFVASGTPEEELLMIARRRGLDRYFRELHGAPKQKPDIVADIVLRHRFDRTEIVFVGDAESDQIAASGNGIAFIARVNSENTGRFQGHPWKIRDLTELDAVLEDIEQ